MAADATALAARIAAALPQTQCTRCGYADCGAYAEAIAAGEAAINRCPPGGAEGVRRLAALSGQPGAPLDAVCGAEGPLRLATVAEDWCIGCTLCLDACPVDAIVGASKAMHVVIAAQCTGCELCVPACPVDCISMLPPAQPGATGWAAWSEPQAERALKRYGVHRERMQRAQREHDERLAALARRRKKSTA